MPSPVNGVYAARDALYARKPISVAQKRRPKATGGSKLAKKAADPSLVALGQRIAALRGPVTQRELALRAGLDVGTVSRLENGRFNPSFKKLQQIAESLGTSLRMIVAGDEPTIDLPKHDRGAIDPLAEYDEAFYGVNARTRNARARGALTQLEEDDDDIALLLQSASASAQEMATLGNILVAHLPAAADALAPLQATLNERARLLQLAQESREQRGPDPS